jgi:hypothetical protein
MREWWLTRGSRSRLLSAHPEADFLKSSTDKRLPGGWEIRLNADFV